eukprot:gene29671-36978_t
MPEEAVSPLPTNMMEVALRSFLDQESEEEEVVVAPQQAREVGDTPERGSLRQVCAVMAELDDTIILRKLQSLDIGGQQPKVSRFGVDIGWIPSKVDGCRTMAQKSAKIRQLADRLITLGCMIDKHRVIVIATGHQMEAAPVFVETADDDSQPARRPNKRMRYTLVGGASADGNATNHDLANARAVGYMGMSHCEEGGSSDAPNPAENAYWEEVADLPDIPEEDNVEETDEGGDAEADFLSIPDFLYGTSCKGGMEIEVEEAAALLLAHHAEVTVDAPVPAKEVTVDPPESGKAVTVDAPEPANVETLDAPESAELSPKKMDPLLTHGQASPHGVTLQE